MTVLIKILQLVLSLSLLVVIHEMGHFLFARIFKTRVEKFYLFFNPWFTLFKVQRGETEYGLGWLPLGGYVKISGMIDESMDKEQMAKPPQPWEFRSKSSGQRLMIMLGGVLFNFIAAMAIYILVLYTWGETYLPTQNVKYGIVTDSTGHAMGLRNGDKILTVDNEPVDNFFQIIPDIILNERKTIQVDRQGMKVDIPISDNYVPELLKGNGQIEARMPFGPFVISEFGKESPAREAGVMLGDVLLGLNGETFAFHDEYLSYVQERRFSEFSMNILRGTDTINIPVVPIVESGMFGITREVSNLFELKTIRYGFAESIPAGIKRGFKTISDYLKQFKLIFSKDTGAYKSLGGFITIGNIFPGEWDWQSFWSLTAFLSIILAIMNILPIPALDGGHVMFLVFEVVTGRKPSDKFMEYAQIAGMFILLSLLLFANGNDLFKLLSKWF